MSTVLLVRIEAIPLEARIIVLAASIVLSASGFGVAKNQADLSELPRLTVEAADSLTAVAERVRGFDATRLRGIMRLTGLTDVGLPIRVVLLSKNSIVARNTPPWIAGFADADRDVVVLFPDRIGSYPYGSLEGVLHHEVAHILTARATAGGRIPRWFNEGLASAAESNWGLDDRSRFAWQMIVGGEVTVTELEGLFGEGPRESARAYVLADALVRDLLEHYGPDTAARVLARMANGEGFEQALHHITGATSTGIVRAFWTRYRTWERWIDFVGRPFTLWSFVTFLALVAIWKARRRRAEKRCRWEAEEQAEDDAWEEHRRRYRVH